MKGRKGTYTKRGENKYRFQYMYKGQRYSETIECNSKRVETELALWINNIEKGSYYNSDYTFYEFAQVWLREVVKPNSSPTTLRRYLSILNNRVFPVLGTYKLTDISPMLLNKYFVELKQSKTMYTNRENTTISKGTFDKVREVIYGILKTAYRFDLIENNPCDKVIVRTDELSTKEIKCYDKDTYLRVLNLLKDESLTNRVIIEAALKSGLRRSELFGLTWDDIDFNNDTITVNKSRHYVKGIGMVTKNTKTKKSVRTIKIPKSLLELLKDYKKEFSNNEYLFEHKSIDGICSWFKDFQKKNKIEPIIRFHDLRHTHATLLLSQGVNVKTISERLGHSSIGITMDVYTHYLKELDESAMEKLDKIV